jgi:hypothetical protein
MDACCALILVSMRCGLLLFRCGADVLVQIWCGCCCFMGMRMFLFRFCAVVLVRFCAVVILLFCAVFLLVLI